MYSPNGDKIFLSVVIPAWNREHEIARCVSSIAGQAAIRPIEIIVVDDASNDGTRLEVQKLARLFPFVRLAERQSRGNAAAARNVGLGIAQGEYIWFVDSDDYVIDGALDLIWTELADARPDILRFDKTNGPASLSSVRGSAEPTSSVTLDLLHSTCAIKQCLSMGSVWNAVFKRTIVGETRFDETFDYGEDAVFTWAVTLRSCTGIYLPQRLYVYMQTSGSLTSSKTSARFVCYMRQVELFMRLIGQSSLQDGIKKELYADCRWRVYSHAFGCYASREIDDEMWGVWKRVYRAVVIDGCRRGCVARRMAMLLNVLQSRQLAYLVYRVMLGIRRRRRS